MPWSNGVYTRSNGVFTGATVWASDASVGTNITTSHHDTHDQDIATGLNNCVTVDGLNQIAANFVPTANGAYNLGSASFRWGNAYFSGNVIVGGGVTLTGNFVPTANGAYNLGSASFQWGNAYFSGNVIMGGGVTLTGTVTGTYTLGGTPTIPGVIPQCGRLAYVSATSINFAPYNGNFVMIAGSFYQIPSAGVSAANTNVYVDGVSGQNLATSTLYYVYLFSNGGTLTVDFSTTTHATDTATGVEIKSGDNTRTLIGMVYTDGSSHFVDTALLRYTASYFGRRNRSASVTGVSVTGYSTSGSYALITGTNVSAVMWGDEDGLAQVSGYLGPPAAVEVVELGLGLDTTSAINLGNIIAYESSASIPVFAPMSAQGVFTPTEGLHTVTANGYTASTTPVTWNLGVTLLFRQ